MPTLRTYRDSDFDQLLVFLNENMDFDEFSAALLHEKLYEDPDWKPENCFIAEKQGKILGFLQAVERQIAEKRYGFIKILTVGKDFRRQGIGKCLYAKAESVFRESGAGVVRLFDVPLNYFMPGIDPRYTPAVCFAQKLGFKRFDDTANLVVNTEQAWKVESRIKALRQENIEIRRANKTDRKELRSFVAEQWALWQHEVEIALQSQPPAVHIARSAGKIRAFAAHNGNNKGTGWFGPMGTHPALRGKGIGAVLLKLCLNDIRARGLKKAIIPWVGPIGFYSHHAGAKVERIFWRYEKKLNTSKTKTR